MPEEVEVAGEEKEDALKFFVAYQQVGPVKRYLGNGKGSVRLFKTHDAIEAYLRGHLSSAEFDRCVIHSVSGEFVVPEPERIEKPMMVPITTLFPLDTPTAEELLQEVVKSRKRHPPKRRL